MSTEKQLPHPIIQSAFTAAALVFVGLPAQLLIIVLDLFEIDARFVVGVVMACVLPVALYVFARTSIKLGMIRPDASPLAITVLQCAAAAFALWLEPQLPASWRSVGRASPGRTAISLTTVITIGIVVSAGWVALAAFSRKPGSPGQTVNESEAEVTTGAATPAHQDPRRLPP